MKYCREKAIWKCMQYTGDKVEVKDFCGDMCDVSIPDCEQVVVFMDDWTPLGCNIGDYIVYTREGFFRYKQETFENHYEIIENKC